MSRSEDTNYMGELRAAVMRRPRVSANILLLAIVGFIVWAVWWADNAPLDEVTVGIGRVIPSSQVQIIQNLEGGIVSTILVREGDMVLKNQPLIVIDDTQFRSKYREDRAKQLALQAVASRLRAEVKGREPKFPETLISEGPAYIENAMALYRARRVELKTVISVLQRRKDQKQQELVELDSRIGQLKKSHALGKEELKIMEPIVAQGATSKVELLRLRREVNDIESSLLAAQQAVPRARAALAEIKQQIQEKRATFHAKARAELNEAEANLWVLEESMLANKDRLRRTKVVSPVSGIIKQIMVNTIGGVVRPGMDLIEIVPREDTLLVEAKVRPSDIAFLRPGQPVKVKVTAYDYAIYGSLDAKLVHISADSIVDENNERFYKIRVRTQRNYLGAEDGKLPIIPGMVAEVDILTGNRTVLQYLLKPILRARQKALRER